MHKHSSGERSMKEIRNLSIAHNESILQALKKMDEVRYKLLIVLKSDKFMSLLSIGDIQRALLKGNDLHTRVSEILRKKEKIRVAKRTDDYDSIRQIMLKFKTEFMPVLNYDESIYRIIFWKDIIKDEKITGKTPLKVPVVIMAGGTGSRLKPLTNIIPKALVPLGEKPILHMIIDKFMDIGISDFIISLNYKAQMIKQYFEELEDLPFTIQYIQEDLPLGTAGSLYLLKGKIKSTFFVTNCDVLVDQDYRDVYTYHRDNGNNMTIISSIKNYPIPYGIVDTGPNGILKKIMEKPELTFQINTGMYILEPDVLDHIPSNTYLDMNFLINSIQGKKGKIGVFPISEKSWTDIGKWNEYQNFINQPHD